MGSLKVVEDDTIQSDTHDFLLTFHSNHWPLSHRLRDKWRFQSKIAKFSHPPRVFNAPCEGVPLGIWYRRKSSQPSKMGLPDGQKRFKIGLVV